MILTNKVHLYLDTKEISLLLIQKIDLKLRGIISNLKEIDTQQKSNLLISINNNDLNLYDLEISNKDQYLTFSAPLNESNLNVWNSLANYSGMNRILALNPDAQAPYIIILSGEDNRIFPLGHSW